MKRNEPGAESPDGSAEQELPNWRIDYRNIEDRARERHRRDAAGASRDIGASLLAGGL